MANSKPDTIIAPERRSNDMAETITLAAPPSLSARPLVYGLEGAADVTLRYEPWNALASVLKSGDVDAALMPSIDYPRLAADVERARTRAAGARPAPTHYTVLPAAVIASRGAVGGLRLVGYVEKDKLRRVLLDPASPTGSAMVRLIVERRFGVQPHFAMPGEGGSAPSRQPDAELLAGDRALGPVPRKAEWDTDLGSEWQRMTYLPMVYALWVARADAPLARLAEILTEATARGLEAREQIAAEAAAKSDLSHEVILRFLTDQTRYTFGLKERQGLEHFLRMAGEDGLTPDGVPVRLAP
jgi:predicted solute-binding protein